MPIRVKCPECDRKVSAPSKYAGKSLKCPDCGGRIRVPIPKERAPQSEDAPPKKKKKKKKREDPALQDAASDDGEAPDSELFISTLDLEAIDHEEFQICPKCQSQIPADEEECPKCDFEVARGGVYAKRTAHIVKPIDTAPFYQEMRHDGVEFVKEHLKLLWVSWGVIFTTVFLAVMSLALVLYCGSSPPKAFWGFIATICMIIGIGWVWFLAVLVIMHTIKSKKPITDKVWFDFARCAADGAKGIAWFFVYTFPFLLVFGGGAYLLQYFTGMTWGYIVTAVLASIVASLSLPQVMSHMAMPVQYRGWLLTEVCAMMKTTFLPGLYWWGGMILSHLPWVIIMATTFFFTQESFYKQIEDLNYNSSVRAARIENFSLVGTKKEENPLAEEELRSVNNELVGIFAGAWLISSGLMSVAVIFNMRSCGLFTRIMKRDLNLIGKAQERAYVGKGLEDDSWKDGIPLLRSLVAPSMNRLVAFGIDYFILMIVLALEWFLFQGYLSFVGSTAVSVFPEPTWEAIVTVGIVFWLSLVGFGTFYLFSMFGYFSLPESQKDMATVGKKIFRLFICDAQGRPITQRQAGIRFCSFVVLWPISWIYGIMRTDGRCLHDLAADTHVRMHKMVVVKEPDEDFDDESD